MESIYDKRFKIEMDYIRKCLNKFAEEDEKKEPRSFYIYIYDLYLSDFKNNRKLAEIKIMNVLASLTAYYPYYGHFRLFYNFLNSNYNSLDLNCFLLLRFMVLKDVDIKNEKTKFKKNKYHLHNFEISAKQCAKYLVEMFKDCEQFSIENILKSIFPKNVPKIFAYDFLIKAIKEYKSIRQGKEEPQKPEIDSMPQITESLEYYETHNSELFDLRIKLKEHMQQLVDKFIESLSREDLPMTNSRRSIIDIRDIIFSKLDSLLNALYDDNKKAWYKELLIEYPDEENISYAIELFNDFKYLSKNNIDDSEKLREFCKRILKTPQVNNQISSLLTYVFGNDESEDSEVDYYSESKQYNSKPQNQAYSSDKTPDIEYHKSDKFETFRSPQFDAYEYKNAYIKEVREEDDDDDECDDDGEKPYNTYNSQPNSNLFLN